ncbi:MAG: hypothetical protein HQ508_06525 [Candidatus Marinimicrobia bacterium]|nr:hypothetical protein [Candidatus Neomarinimicrobiota bacterium]
MFDGSNQDRSRINHLHEVAGPKISISTVSQIATHIRRYQFSLFVRTHIFLLVFIFFTNGALCTSEDSLAYSFSQDNLSTNNDFQFNYKIGLPRGDLLITDALHYKVFSYDNSLAKEKQYSVEHRLKSDWSWGKNRGKSIRIESSQHQDHRTGLAATIENWALLAGLKHGNTFSAYFGGRSVERYGIVDDGWTTELDLHKVWQSEVQQSTINASGSRDQLNEHLSHNLEAQAEYRVRFGIISTFQTSLLRESRSQSFFTDSLGSSQSRNNENLQWQNRFTYNLSKNLQLSHLLNWGDQLTEISQEKVNPNSTIRLPGEDRKRFALLNETTLKLNNPTFSSLTGFKIENSQNKYYVDYTQVFYQLRQEIEWQNQGLSDSLSWSMLLSRLEYDTPDTTNDDDRDEWRLNTELRFAWQPSPFYTLDIGAKLGMFHLIYLFNTRSSENNWNRNLVLWSGFSWHRNAWEGAGRARIRSNYFDYDYDDFFIEYDQPTRSFVHRSLDIQKQLSYRFSRRWSITSKVAARWEDEGKLHWKSFVQQVSSQREQSEVTLKLFYSQHGWEGWLGYLTHERLIEYAIGNREAQRWSGSGPLMGVRYRLGRRVFLKGDARFISVQDQDREYLLPKVFVTLTYR